jgi:3-oxoacyl-[acyl-carrier-protein] synthase II
MTTRVVITGIGLVTPVGNDVATTWEALCAGRSGISQIARYDTTGWKVPIAGEVKDFDPTPFLSKKEQRRNDRVMGYAFAATHEALAQAQLPIHNMATEVGVVIGSGIGGMESHSTQFEILSRDGPDRISPFYILQAIPDMISGMISISTGARGPNFAIVSACATGANAIGEAYEIIRRGDAQAMITGGAESPITPISMGAFANMRTLSRYAGDPAQASRPFDAARDGFVMGEGAGIMVLEDLELAQTRGATILGEIVGYGASADAYHATDPAPEGAGLQMAMRRAIQKAHVTMTDIGYINAHGTATPYNDQMETIAIKHVFGEHAYRLAVSSTKSMIGHTFGAAGAIEAAVTALALRERILPPTINLTQPDPACDLDYIPNHARQVAVDVALSNSMGFGGHNACLALRRWDDA